MGMRTLNRFPKAVTMDSDVTKKIQGLLRCVSQAF